MVSVNNDMIAYCYDSLLAHYDKQQLPIPSFTNDSFPLFVTWKITKKDELRGCIGTFQSIPLIDGLNRFALQSALKDTRFSPISKIELPKLDCSVSLLIKFEKAADVWDWEVGKHGIRIEFEDSNGNERGATYLPEVMPEQGWTKEQALKSLIKKAGCYEKVDKDFYSRIELTRYQSSKLTMTYDEYLQHKKK